MNVFLLCYFNWYKTLIMLSVPTVTLFYIIWCLFSVFVCLYIYHICAAQQTSWRNEISPPTMWIQGIELRLPSHQPNKLHSFFALSVHSFAPYLFICLPATVILFPYLPPSLPPISSSPLLLFFLFFFFHSGLEVRVLWLNQTFNVADIFRFYSFEIKYIAPLSREQSITLLGFLVSYIHIYSIFIAGLLSILLSIYATCIGIDLLMSSCKNPFVCKSTLPLVCLYFFTLPINGFGYFGLFFCCCWIIIYFLFYKFYSHGYYFLFLWLNSFLFS